MKDENFIWVAVAIFVAGILAGALTVWGVHRHHHEIIKTNIGEFILRDEQRCARQHGDEMNELDSKLIEGYRNIIMQIIHVGNLIPVPVDDKDLTWEFARWSNRCAIESLESAIIYITELRDSE